jgi:hypothetical protein
MSTLALPSAREKRSFVNDLCLRVKKPLHAALAAGDMCSCGVGLGPTGIHAQTGVVTAAISVLTTLRAQ